MTTKSLIFEILGVNKSGPATKAAAAGVNYLGGAFSRVGNIVGGDFGNAISTAGQGLEDFEGKSVKAAQKLQIAGGIITGLGLALTVMGSKEAQASAQLKQSITDSGHSYEDYSKQIEDAIATGESFDHNAVDTQGALAKLTTALGDPAKALKQMALVTDLAAQNHTSLTAAAKQVILVLDGKGSRVLNQYGITMASSAGATKALTSAQAAVTSKSAALAKAQENLRLTEQLLAGKTTLTAAEHVKLEKAQYGVTTAAGVLKTAQDNLTTAQKNASDANGAGQKALDQLSGKLKGEASSSVDNFGSQVDIIKTKIEDWVDLMGSKFGPAISGFGGAVQVVGVGLDIYRARQAALAAAAEAATTATVAETGAQEGLDAAMDANPIGGVVLALAALVALIGGAVLLSGTNANTLATVDFTDALQGNTGAINKNIRAIATKALLDDGALKAAQKMGIGIKDVVDASLGNVAAQKRVNAGLDAYKTKMEAAFNAQADKNGTDILGIQYQQGYARNIGLVGDAIGSVDGQLKSQTANQKLYNEGLGDTALAAQAAAAGVAALEKNIIATSKLGPMVYEGGTLVPVHPAAPSKSTSTGKAKPRLAAGGIVNPRRAGVDVTVAEAGNPELVAPLPRGFDIASAMAGGTGITNVYHVTVKGGLVQEKRMIRDLQRTKNRVQRRGGIAKGAF